MRGINSTDIYIRQYYLFLCSHLWILARLAAAPPVPHRFSEYARDRHTTPCRTQIVLPLPDHTESRQITRTMQLRYKGEFLTLAAFVLWGLVALYYHTLSELGAEMIFALRLILSVPFVVLALTFIPRLRPQITSTRQLAWALIAGSLISLSWYVNLWGTLNGELVAVSLAFFLSPLLTIVAGVLFFGERLRKRQWTSLLICSGAFLLYCIANGGLPWLTVIIASCFALYGVVKRLASVREIDTLLGELVMFLPLSLGFVCSPSVELNLSGGDKAFFWVLMLVPVYFLPVLLFGAGIKRARSMNRVGMLSYSEPLLQFMLALLVFQEPISELKAVAILIIWIGVLVTFDWEKLMKLRQPFRPSNATQDAPTIKMEKQTA